MEAPVGKRLWGSARPSDVLPRCRQRSPLVPAAVVADDARDDARWWWTVGSARACVAIVDPPRATPAPVSPNRPLLLIAVLMLSLGIGTGLAILRDRLDPVFFDARSLRAYSKAPLLGTVGMVMDASAEASERRDRLRFAGSVSLFALLFLAAATVSALLNSGR